MSVMYLGDDFIAGGITGHVQDPRSFGVAELDERALALVGVHASRAASTATSTRTAVSPTASWSPRSSADTPNVPSAHRLLLGDHSKVQIHP